MSAASTPIVFGEALVDAFADALIPGGAPFNVACHLAVFGLAPLLLSRIGKDAAGRQLEAAARHCGLALEGVQTDTRWGTPRVLVCERDGRHSFRIPAELAFDHLDADAATRAVVSRLTPGTEGWLYHGTLALRAAATRRALAAVRDSGEWRVFVDLNWREAGPSPTQILSRLHGIEVLKLSEAELTRVLGWLQLAPPSEARPDEGSMHSSLAALAEHTGARWILVTHGGEGAALWDGAGRCHASIAATAPTRLVDTVGAGDAFSACMLAALLRGKDAAEALVDAVAFASASCGWRGAIPTDRRAYEFSAAATTAPCSSPSELDP